MNGGMNGGVNGDDVPGGPTDPINELREPPLDTSEGEPAQSRTDLPPNISDEDIAAFQPPDDWPADTGDPEDRVPGEPLTDDEVDQLALAETEP
jgi:hypothetical protein